MAKVAIGKHSNSSGTGNFDPAAHLSKQGWKGKGTALKNGHLTRPLAVVQKRSLTGVGRDRDEAVPFWDQIFAATAASLSLPASLVASPAASPSPTPALTPSLSGNAQAGPSRPRLADPRTVRSSSWQTGASTNVPGAEGRTKLAGLDIAVRIGRESARRGLYAKFLRGETLSLRNSPEPETGGDSGGTTPQPSAEDLLTKEPPESLDSSRSPRETKERKEKKHRKRKAVQTDENVQRSKLAEEESKKREKRNRVEVDASVATPAHLTISEKEAKKMRKEARRKEREEKGLVTGAPQVEVA